MKDRDRETLPPGPSVYDCCEGLPLHPETPGYMADFLRNQYSRDHRREAQLDVLIEEIKADRRERQARTRLDELRHESHEREIAELKQRVSDLEGQAAE